MKIRFLILLIVCVTLNPHTSQCDGIWKTYVNGNDINDIATYGDYVWCATNGSLVRWDKQTSEYLQFTLRDGLVDKEIQYVTLDGTGLPWIAYNNTNTLSHFNGVAWNHFNDENAAIPDNDVTGLLCDLYGNLWAGTKGAGLVRYDGSSWETINSEHVLDVTPKSIAIDHSGVKWFGTSNGAYRLENETWQHFTTDDGLAGETVNSIAIDSKGTVWFGTNKGVTRFDGTTWKSYTIGDGLNENNIKAILSDMNDNIWVGTWKGAARFDGTSWESYNDLNGLASKKVTDIVVDHNNTVWFCHSEENIGVSVFDGEKWGNYSTYNTDISGDDVYAITCDDSGVMWFVSGKELFNFDGALWKTFYIPAGLKDKKVKGLVTGANNEKWILFDKIENAGAALFDGSDWTNISAGDASVDNYFSSAARDADNTLWLGVTEGFAGYDGVSWDYYPKNDRLISPNINDMAQDIFDDIWCATDNGLSCFDGVSWRTYTNGDGLPSNELYKVETTGNGIVWCITKDGELVSFDHNSFRVHELVVDDKHASFFQMAANRNNELWLKYYKLYTYDGETWNPYEIGMSLFGNFQPSIKNIIVDDDIIWCSTYEGLKSFDGTSWSSFVVDGLMNELFRYNNSTVVTEDNRIFFGSMNGYSMFDGTSWAHGFFAADNVIVDNFNNIWFAGHTGISCLSGDELKTYDYRTALNSNPMTFNCIAFDNNNVFWAGTDRYGVIQFDESVWQKYSKDDVLVYNNISEIVVDHDNVKWIVYNDQSSGVTSFDGTKWKTWKQADGLASNHIMTVKVDTNNVKWFVTYNAGISSYNGKTWKTFTESDGLIDNSIQFIEEDHNNVLWFGGYPGLSSFDGTTWTSYETNELGFVFRPQVLAVDNNNVKWIGSLGGGVSSFDGTTWHHYDKIFLDLNFVIVDIIVDKNNIKWFVSNDTLISYDDRTGITSGKTPQAITILGNYPNPFNAETNIRFDLYEWGVVDLVIYNIMGQKVRELAFGDMNAGRHAIPWDGTGSLGRVSSGIYFYQVKSGKHAAGDRLMFVK
ncbi:two-component regulator propeller domain-containing protein [Candidatus Omnitrophota bacterium]